MISRYKWYEVRLPGTVSDFLKKIGTHNYTPDKTTGFIVDETQTSFRYIWQSTISAQRLDNYGNAENQDIVTINSQDISIIGSARIVFRVENPARSIRELMNSLERIVGFGFSCQQITIKEEDILAALEPVENKKLNSLKVSGAIVKAKALARIELASKEGLDPTKIEILRTGEFVVDAASYEVSYKGVKGQVGFSKSGACKISGQLTGFLLENIERVLLVKAG